MVRELGLDGTFLNVLGMFLMVKQIEKDTLRELGA